MLMMMMRLIRLKKSQPTLYVAFISKLFLKKPSDIINILQGITDIPQNGCNRIEKPLVSKIFISKITFCFLFLSA